MNSIDHFFSTPKKSKKKKIKEGSITSTSDIAQREDNDIFFFDLAGNRKSGMLTHSPLNHNNGKHTYFEEKETVVEMVDSDFEMSYSGKKKNKKRSNDNLLGNTDNEEFFFFDLTGTQRNGNVKHNYFKNKDTIVDMLDSDFEITYSKKNKAKNKLLIKKKKNSSNKDNNENVGDEAFCNILTSKKKKKKTKNSDLNNEDLSNFSDANTHLLKNKKIDFNTHIQDPSFSFDKKKKKSKKDKKIKTGIENNQDPQLENSYFSDNNSQILDETKKKKKRIKQNPYFGIKTLQQEKSKRKMSANIFTEKLIRSDENLTSSQPSHSTVQKNKSKKKKNLEEANSDKQIQDFLFKINDMEYPKKKKKKNKDDICSQETSRKKKKFHTEVRDDKNSSSINIIENSEELDKNDEVIIQPKSSNFGIEKRKKKKKSHSNELINEEIQDSSFKIADMESPKKKSSENNKELSQIEDKIDENLTQLEMSYFVTAIQKLVNRESPKIKQDDINSKNNKNCDITEEVLKPDETNNSIKTGLQGSIIEEFAINNDNFVKLIKTDNEVDKKRKKRKNESFNNSPIAKIGTEEDINFPTFDDFLNLTNDFDPNVQYSSGNNASKQDNILQINDFEVEQKIKNKIDRTFGSTDYSMSTFIDSGIEDNGFELNVLKNSQANEGIANNNNSKFVSQDLFENLNNKDEETIENIKSFLEKALRKSMSVEKDNSKNNAQQKKSSDKENIQIREEVNKKIKDTQEKSENETINTELDISVLKRKKSIETISSDADDELNFKSKRTKKATNKNLNFESYPSDIDQYSDPDSAKTKLIFDEVFTDDENSPPKRKKRRTGSDKDEDSYSCPNESVIYDELTEDEIDVLRNLIITLPFGDDIPPIHKIKRPSKPTSEDLQNASFLNAKNGPFSKREDARIIKNWNIFCKSHNLNVRPEVFFKFKRVLGMQEKIKFLQFISHGLDDRMPFRVHCRFKKLFESRCLNKGRYTFDEDNKITEFMSNTNSLKPFYELSMLLNRSANSLERRFHFLTYTKNADPVKWDIRMAERMIKGMMEIIETDDVKILEHAMLTPKQWKQLSRILENIPVKKLQRAWNINVHPKLFMREYKDDVKHDLMKMLIYNKETDFRSLSWHKYAEHFSGITARKLNDIFRIMMMPVPKKYKNDLKSVLEYLSLHMKRKRNYPQLRYKYKNGELRCKKVFNKNPGERVY